MGYVNGLKCRECGRNILLILYMSVNSASGHWKLFMIIKNKESTDQKEYQGKGREPLAL